jgi:hypothetical protein
MMGWHISIFRQAEGRSAPASAGAEEGPRLAVWQTGLDGLQWLDELVAAGNAIDLGGNGYPSYYTAQAEHIISRVVAGPPLANRTWAVGENDILMPGWEGKTVIDRAVADDCRPDEWLIIIVWDES